MLVKSVRIELNLLLIASEITKLS